MFRLYEWATNLVCCVSDVRDELVRHFLNDEEVSISSSESCIVTHLGINNTHSSNGSGGETGGSTISKSITWRIMSPVAVSYAVLPLSKSGLISASCPVSTSWKVHQLRGSVYMSARAIFQSILSIKSSSN